MEEFEIGAGLRVPGDLTPDAARRGGVLHKTFSHVEPLLRQRGRTGGAVSDMVCFGECAWRATCGCSSSSAAALLLSKPAWRKARPAKAPAAVIGHRQCCCCCCC